MIVINDQLTIVRTADGSNTIFNPQVGENYHSTHGALQESRHVFINAGFQYFMGGADTPKESVSILEVGFGTGLNFLLTADAGIKAGVPLAYTGIEAYPLTKGMINQTGYDTYIPADLWQQFIDNYTTALVNKVQLNPLCQLEIVHLPLLAFQSAQLYDIIYFDAFASAYQPEMWDETAIAHTVKYLKPGGVFVTYAITGSLKRALRALNCKVEKAPGAPGKREMLRAVKLKD
ncbi:tRNA (5-methylaminomethyl-2-thiouridine)(34)-methyltransferase MnmD [Mucilaginibacter xinganensis]|uniref:tRNA (5-methylaminomethyl-2-thiouridylate)-methyltransferase n=1 Tax=Mucilaginibacter xinganensis TaxID=1234841 RepID=A0A223P124_9SPHI|nr:tRNA (5-methylaminomethyl-2-thiouridine)(34)-methyltransferase MnmD [Mucilaginibacter xinganensis]ASU35541.1 tRNA (5-methylaminomethyl-2-thiouridylate)-methyltransferase [Mucilaginibacter xinganensis]